MDAIERHVTLPAGLEAAWELLTNPDDLAAWLGREVDLDPTPGAVGSVVDHDGTHHQLVVDEVEPRRRLAWRWWTDGIDEPSRVEITVAPSEHGTVVRVVEERLPAPAAGHSAEAWSHRLLHLEALLLVAAAVRG
jgi:uncharacterized protein YndB with AHSA1/START domain